jgi:hypothetical protein
VRISDSISNSQFNTFVVTSASEAIHRAAKFEAGLLRRFRSSQRRDSELFPPLLRAERSNPSRREFEAGLLRYARNDGTDHRLADTHPRSRGVKTPELCQQLPSKTEGAGNAGCALHPQSRMQK